MVKQVKNITIGRLANDKRDEGLSGARTVRHTSTQENQDIRVVTARQKLASPAGKKALVTRRSVFEQALTHLDSQTRRNANANRSLFNASPGQALNQSVDKAHAQSLYNESAYEQELAFQTSASASDSIHASSVYQQAPSTASNALKETSFVQR